MHSIVVLGDVRTHSIVIEPESFWREKLGCLVPEIRSEYSILGGCAMMGNVIKKALDESGNPLGNRLKCLGVDCKELKTSYGALFYWALRPFPVDGQPTPRPRLAKLGVVRSAEKELEFSDDLVKIIADPDGQFHPLDDTKTKPQTLQKGANEDQLEQHKKEKAEFDAYLANCRSPDIVIIDDLNQVARKAFTKLKYSKKTRASKNTTDNRFERAAQEILLRCEKVLDDRHNKFLRKPMEPVIIGSIKLDPHKVFQSSENEGKKSIWHHLHDNERLRDRTILLLDADDLRRASLPVSTGLSWERTAQETLAQLRRSRDLNNFLDFGQLIIRYGASGVLHIAKRGRNYWSYTLHFAPHYHDASWTVPSRNGEMLGLSSIIVASIVVGLVDNCKHEDGKPYIGDFADVVESVLPQSIRRCSWFYREVGYGRESYAEFQRKFASGENSDAKVTLIPEGIFCPDFFQVNSVAFTGGISNVPMVTHAAVPPGISAPHWSIAGQSVQTRVSEVARDIVHFGAKYIFNQPLISLSDKCDVIVSAVHKFIDRIRIATKDGKEIQEFFNKQDFDDFVASIVANGLIESRSQGLPQSLLDCSRYQFKSWLAKAHKKDDSEAWEKLQQVVKLHCVALSKQENNVGAKINKTELKFRSEVMEVADILIKSQKLREPIAAPMAEFGRRGKSQLEIVDRREIEGFRAIERLMRRHIELVRGERSDRPLCLAVFGPPGSGKSTAVKRINESLNDPSTEVLDAFNVSQFASIADLAHAFEQIQNKGGGSRVPIACFDEFDCRYPGDSEPWGWLKYFLAPMEDGRFRDHPIKNAILVFAGGTSKTFSEFSLNERSNTDPQWITFSKQKGPDFVSRIRGHIDIIGINPTDADDEMYLIRRAVVVRNMLTIMQSLSPGEEAKIESNILQAILHVPEYYHGARALRMLLELCRDNDGRISSSEVPPIHQINMLVDGQAFMDQLANRRT